MLLCCLQYVPLARIQTTTSMCQNNYWDGNWYGIVLYSPVGLQKEHGQHSNHLRGYKHHFELLHKTKSKSTACESSTSILTHLEGLSWWMLFFEVFGFGFLLIVTREKKTSNEIIKIWSNTYLFLPELSRAAFNKYTNFPTLVAVVSCFSFIVLCEITAWLTN